MKIYLIWFFVFINALISSANMSAYAAPITETEIPNKKVVLIFDEELNAAIDGHKISFSEVIDSIPRVARPNDLKADFFISLPAEASSEIVFLIAKAVFAAGGGAVINFTSVDLVKKKRTTAVLDGGKIAPRNENTPILRPDGKLDNPNGKQIATEAWIKAASNTEAARSSRVLPLRISSGCTVESVLNVLQAAEAAGCTLSLHFETK